MTATFDYPRLLQRALRTLVREVLTVTAGEGLPGDHHFYLSLRTDRADVNVPPFLRQRYPEEMTIVLQNQFWDLQVDDEGFAVTLRFDGMPARLEVPFDAVVAFFDPTAQFGLRFDLAGLGGTTPPVAGAAAEGGSNAGAPEETANPADGTAAPAAADGDGERSKPQGEARVLSFDRARERRDPEPED